MRDHDLKRHLSGLSPEQRLAAIQQIEPMMQREMQIDPDRKPYSLVEMSPLDWTILLEEYQKAGLPMNILHVSPNDPESYLRGIRHHEVLWGMRAWPVGQGWLCKVVPELAIEYARRILAALSPRMEPASA